MMRGFAIIKAYEDGPSSREKFRLFKNPTKPSFEDGMGYILVDIIILKKTARDIILTNNLKTF